jgi:hypothetical protein
MSMWVRGFRWVAALSAAGVLFSGNCLADNFWSTLWGDTIITGAVATVLDAVLGRFPLLQ